MDWAPQQYAAIEKAVAWFNDWQAGKKVPQVHRIFGYAGTGKTTIAKEIARQCGAVGRILYGAYTGKAALVLRSKGCFGASTIHSMIYDTEVDQDGKPIWFLNRGSVVKNSALVIIDECSMVGKEIGQDLLSFKVPILVLGDPAQLPPPSGAGFFTNHAPDSMMTDIHRQGKDNPIIWMATQVREGNMLAPGQYGDSIVSNETNIEMVDDYDQVLCGRNETRMILNSQIRAHLGMIADYPVVGDRMICLRNDRKLGIYNGTMMQVKRVDEERNVKDAYFWRGRMDDLDTPGSVVDVKVNKNLLNPSAPAVKDWRWLSGSQELYYGYAITAHKSQGSQWDNVLIFDESRCFRDDWNRWLYTAITRAANKVRVVA